MSALELRLNVRSWRRAAAASVRQWVDCGRLSGYADHMATEEFHHGVERLLTLAAARRTAIMCSEAVWWRCHRALVADHLKSTGVTVYHILSVTKTEEHRYTSAARIADGKLTYRAN